MKRIYLAGAYRGATLWESLLNIRRGIKYALLLLSQGYAVYVPWLDYLLVLMQDAEDELNLEIIMKNSIAWMKASDALFIIPKSENSEGTKKEITIAKTLKIPIFHNLTKLQVWRAVNA